MRRVLTDEQVLEICNLYTTENHNCVTLSKLYKVDRTTIEKYLKLSGVNVYKKQFEFRKPKCKEGEIYTTKEGYDALIIKVNNSQNIEIFLDGHIIKNVSQNTLIKGEIKNRNKKSVFGVGYIGYGKYKAKKDNKIVVSYSRWIGVLKRCYYEPHIIKNPTYIGCSVDERWHNFQVFAEWFESNWKPWMDETWHLDKDILIKGNKIYSPETCAFVPHQINNLNLKRNILKTENPIGVRGEDSKFTANIHFNKKINFLGEFNTKEEAFISYKKAKENWVKSVIDIWKDKITEDVYNTLFNYSIEIED